MTPLQMAERAAFIANALHVAAEQYDTDSKVPGLPERIAEQFQRQVAQANLLAAEFEQGSELESLIDNCGLAALLIAIAAVCEGKADRIREKHGPTASAHEWERADISVVNCARSSAVANVSS